MAQFRSRYNTYVTSVTVDGVQVPVEFTSIRYGGSYFSTDNKKIIAELKKHHSDFCFMYIDDVEVKVVVDETIEEQEEVSETKIVESVKNISEAKEYLRGLDIAFQKLNTPENIMAWAKKKNVEFPNLK